MTKQIRQKYCNSHLTVQYSLDAPTRAPLDDMFVDLRLQKFETRKLPETLPYRDVEEMQPCKQSSEAIQIPQLFDALEDKDAPHNVLIRGKAGVGKTTLVKKMAKQWAEKKLWNDIKYLFVVTLRELPQDSKWTLADLLLGELRLSEDEKTVAINEICKHSKDTMVAIEGLDEFPKYKFSEKRGGMGNVEVDLNVLISGIIRGKTLEGAKVIVTSRLTDQLPSEEFDCVTEIYGFSKENIEKYVDKYSGSDSELQLFIRRFLDTNVNIATMCYIPIQANFVCMCLQDMHSCKLTGDVVAVATITQLYVFATLYLIRKLHPALKKESIQMESEAILNRVGESLKKHAKVAKCCTLSSPLRLILYETDIEKISTEDRQSGFLDESQTPGAVTRGQSRKCWSFTHFTLQEFLTAVYLLIEQPCDMSSLKTSVHQHEVLLTFVVGLLCDRSNAKFMTHFVSADNQQLKSRNFIEQLKHKTEPLQLITLVHEAQREDLVEIVPAEIESSQLHPTKVMALAWLLKQQTCPITSLK